MLPSLGRIIVVILSHIVHVPNKRRKAGAGRSSPARHTPNSQSKDVYQIDQSEMAFKGHKDQYNFTQHRPDYCTAPQNFSCDWCPWNSPNWVCFALFPLSGY